MTPWVASLATSGCSAAQDRQSGGGAPGPSLTWPQPRTRQQGLGLGGRTRTQNPPGSVAGPCALVVAGSWLECASQAQGALNPCEHE